MHIVSFDIPWPADYGGVIDVFCKVKALSEAGVHMTLHCFEYGRAHSNELEKLCNKVYYYPRKSGLTPWLSALPYIVAGRRSEELVQNLLKDSSPVLFEGLHCCALLADPRLAGRKKFVRMHNIEHDYYRSLAEKERSFLKRVYFTKESSRLKKFERCLKFATKVLAISEKDTKELSLRYDNIICLPAFHPDETVRCVEQKQDYALYHGNLSVGENDEAALFLVREVFSKIKHPLRIAGRSPSAELQNEVRHFTHISLYTDLTSEQIREMVRNASVNILPTFQSTGIKLKLLSALYNGGHCLVNTPMISETGLDELCVIADSADAFCKAINELTEKPFSREEIQKRESILQRTWSNKSNAQKLIWLLQQNP